MSTSFSGTRQRLRDAGPRRENITGKCPRFGCRVNGRRRRLGVLRYGYGCLHIDYCRSLLKFGLVPPSLVTHLLSATETALFNGICPYRSTTYGVLLITKRAWPVEDEEDPAVAVIRELSGASGACQATQFEAMREVFRLALEYGCNQRTRLRIARRFRQVDPLGYAMLALELGRDPHANVKAGSTDEAVAAICQRLLSSSAPRTRLIGLRWLEDPSEAMRLLNRATTPEVPRVSTWRDQPSRRNRRLTNPSILWDFDFRGEHGTNYIESRSDEREFLAREHDALWAEIERLPVGWHDWL